MLIDDKLRKVLVESAEEIGISASFLLEWARTLTDDCEARTPNEGDILGSVILEMLRDGDLRISGISNQRPVLTLTKQGERARDPHLKESAAEEFYARPPLPVRADTKLTNAQQAERRGYLNRLGAKAEIF
ncbi:MAG TPA: hypothetical protein VKN18_29530 [Blastocatellia bacterium]|nr:hypothetical protein [Blastocatellia bacterium]